MVDIVSSVYLVALSNGKFIIKVQVNIKNNASYNHNRTNIY